MTNLQQAVTLYFKGANLKDTDSFSKSDPYAVLMQGSAVIGTTKAVLNTASPNWNEGFDVPYYFEANQDFTIMVYDDDGKGPRGDDLVAKVDFRLAHVMGSKGLTKTFPATPGSITVTAEPSATTGNDTVEIGFVGRKMRNMDMIGKSDPYFVLSRVQPNGSKTVLHKSETKDNTLDPVWRYTKTLKVSALTAADMSTKSLLFECFDEDTSSDESMGFVSFSFQELTEAHQKQTPFVLRNAKKEDFGQVLVAHLNIVKKPSFVDLLRGGLQINVAVAVDFTGSNGDPRQKTSLHYRNPNEPNQYMKAIMSVCDILLEYDSDKMVPAFGFGAREPNGNITHFFHLNQQQSPYVPGVQGVLDAYAHSLNTMQLAGPTNFSPTINSVRRLLAEQSGANTYTVLLILTDGEITDMEDTIDAIVASETAPLSIVIVGIGNGSDFQSMSQLDGDGGRLVDSRGRRSTRDIVQFVPFNRFVQAPPQALAAEVLKEVPNQVCQWSEMRH
jgi:hypothetical protein